MYRCIPSSSASRCAGEASGQAPPTQSNVFPARRSLLNLALHCNNAVLTGFLLMERGEFIMRGHGETMPQDGVREALAV